MMSVRVTIRHEAPEDAPYAPGSWKRAIGQAKVIRHEVKGIIRGAEIVEDGRAVLVDLELVGDAEKIAKFKEALEAGQS